jgi:RNA polymerase subunit RPABC4/transcription elongation factor Spt4
MVIALYRRVHREPCPRCERLRPIDRNTCSNCGSAWEPMQAEGIEIIDSDSRFNATVQRANAELGATY